MKMQVRPAKISVLRAWRSSASSKKFETPGFEGKRYKLQEIYFSFSGARVCSAALMHELPENRNQTRV